MTPLFKNSSKRPGTLFAGIFSAAVASVFLLCGAGNDGIKNFTPSGQMQSDLNAGGHNVTNAGTVSGTNVIANAFATSTSGASLTNLHGYNAESVSATGSSALASLGRVSADTLTLNAGASAYVVSRSLADAGAQAGDVYLINVSYPASTNPTLNIYDNSTSGTLLSTTTGTAIAGTTTLEFVFNGTNWVHYAKGAVLTKNLGNGVQTAVAADLNSTGGLQGYNSTLATLAAGNPFSAGSNVTLTGAWPAITIASSGTGGGGTTSPGGTPGQIQYNNAGIFGGLSAIPISQGGTGNSLYNVKSSTYAALGNVQTYTGLTTTSGSPNITVTGYTFTSADIGKEIWLSDGASGGSPLISYITAVSSGAAVLNTNAGQTNAASGTAVFGTNDTSAIQAAINAASTAGGGTVYLPTGTYAITSLTWKSNVSLKGEGPGKSILKILNRNNQTAAAIVGTSGTYYDCQFEDF